MDFKQWVNFLISNHKKPIRKLAINRTKDSKTSDDNIEKLNNDLEILKTAYNSPRVEIRSNRSVSEWLPNEKQSLIHKIHGSKLAHMGFQNRIGKYLDSFETLFLLETNRLELFMANIPMTIQQAYNLLLANNENQCNYGGYRKLALLDYELSRNKNSEEVTKHVAKKIKLCETESQSSSHIEHCDVFKKLQAEGPKTNLKVLDKTCDWVIKKNNVQFNLHFLNSDELDPSIGIYRNNEERANLFAWTNQELSFLKVGSIKLPELL